MPIFEYECSDCSNKFEELVSSSDSTVKCPGCGSEKTRKLLSVFAASASSSTPAPSCGGGGGGCSSGFG